MRGHRKSLCIPRWRARACDRHRPRWAAVAAFTSPAVASAGWVEIRAFSVPRCRGRNGQGGGPPRRVNGVRPSRGAPRFHPLPSLGDRGRRPLPCAPPIRLPRGRRFVGIAEGGTSRQRSTAATGGTPRRHAADVSSASRPPGPGSVRRRQRVSESGGVQSLSRRQPLIVTGGSPVAAPAVPHPPRSLLRGPPAPWSRWVSLPRGRWSVPVALRGHRLRVGRCGLGPGRAADVSSASPWGPVGPLRWYVKKLSRPYRRNTFAGQAPIYKKRHFPSENRRCRLSPSGPVTNGVGCYVFCSDGEK